jgi:hypothetical protein
MTTYNELASLFTQQEALALINHETPQYTLANFASPNNCIITTRAVTVSEGYPRKQLSVQDLPLAVINHPKYNTWLTNKAKRKVLLHAVAAVAAGLNITNGDVSHRCPRGKKLSANQAQGTYGCINPHHFVIESHADNMGRINCTRNCPCCTQYICQHGLPHPANAGSVPNANGGHINHRGCID